jgi:anhydro-N-acetylmuramic acid kinase
MFYTALRWKTSTLTALQVAEQANTDYFIGIMSGTSMDAIDAVLVGFNEQGQPQGLEAHSQAFPPELRSQLIACIQPDWQGPLSELASLHVTLGELYAEASNHLIKKSRIPPEAISAIGNHGQTVWHQPDQPPYFSWQLGDANRIAELTGITTVADFRNRDMAAGGQGAPLVPAFHQAVFAHPSKNRVIVNIGGISNISVLCPDQQTFGFDTGPGNALMDAWSLRERGLAYDESGNWARSGKVIPELLSALLEDPYFKRSYPKSTGKEHFNLHWLDSKLNTSMAAADVQTTLVELTAQTIVDSSTQACNAIDEVYICGGGAKNDYLMQRLNELFSPTVVGTTDDLGVNADWVEAMAFAWLARQTLLGLPGNLPAVTGASGLRVLGAIYPAG